MRTNLRNSRMLVKKSLILLSYTDANMISTMPILENIQRLNRYGTSETSTNKLLFTSMKLAQVRKQNEIMATDYRVG